MIRDAKLGINSTLVIEAKFDMNLLDLLGAEEGCSGTLGIEGTYNLEAGRKYRIRGWNTGRGVCLEVEEIG